MNSLISQMSSINVSQWKLENARQEFGTGTIEAFFALAEHNYNLQNPTQNETLNYSSEYENESEPDLEKEFLENHSSQYQPDYDNVDVDIVIGIKGIKTY
jgi:hypothetical protein